MDRQQLEALVEMEPEERSRAMQRIRSDRAANAIFDLFEMDMELRGHR